MARLLGKKVGLSLDVKVTREQGRFVAREEGRFVTRWQGY